MTRDEFNTLEPGDMVVIRSTGDNDGIICEVVNKRYSNVIVDCLTRPAKRNGEYCDEYSGSYRNFDILKKVSNNKFEEYVDSRGNHYFKAYVC